MIEEEEEFIIGRCGIVLYIGCLYFFGVIYYYDLNVLFMILDEKVLVKVDLVSGKKDR